jgi:hypothetical protein
MKPFTSASPGNVPDVFLSKFGSGIQGAISGFDRLRLRGTLRHLFQPTVMEAYLNACRVLIKDFGRFAEGITNRIKAAVYAAAEKKQRPYRYLPSSQLSKEQVAKQIARQDQVQQGLIAILGCVEPCLSYVVRGNKQTKHIHMELAQRKCMHFYHYYLHPLLGFMHVRVQSWFPFTININLNGREWLARQLDRAQIAYRKKENCFVWIEDLAKAQVLLQQQLHTDWPRLLNGLLEDCHPLHREICRPIHQQYYWSASDTEYATDVLFQDAGSLAKLYPQFVHHGMSSFASPDVMRFLGRYVPTSTGRVYGQFKGEIISDVKHRPEGIRIKHSLNSNSIKLYDKQGSVLRVETTIVRPSEFKVYRTAEKDPEGELAWRELRRGLADLPRRAEVSHAANQRYLTALAAVTGATRLSEVASEICQPIIRDGQRYRALNPWSKDDGALLEAISRGEFAINGLRNRDLQGLLYKGKAVPHQEQRRRAAAITRKLRLLRGHGVLKKVSGTHRYVLTAKGREIITALLAARQADVEKLSKMAA